MVSSRKEQKYPWKHGVKNPKNLKGNLPIRTATGAAMAHHGVPVPVHQAEYFGRTVQEGSTS
jgi:hypothetical protein